MLYTCVYMYIYIYICVCVCACISYHIISYHIISYHITSHHITSHHIISLSLSLLFSTISCSLSNSSVSTCYSHVSTDFPAPRWFPRGSPVVPRLTLCGSKRSSSSKAGSLGTAELLAHQWGSRSSEPGTKPSLEGPGAAAGDG